MKSGLEWKAQWIWNEGAESPRNEWWCFRKTFEVPAEGWSDASFSITADSRYVLYINGEQAGRGPVRSWPFEQSYDTYEVGHLLKPGRLNSIAVLVLHFGISHFSYIRGRGGLLAQLDLSEEGACAASIVTDGSWKTTRYAGQDSRSPRLSLQLAFAEQIDARQFEDNWTQTDCPDGGWANAAVIGEVGMAPWTSLMPKDIPHLTEELIYPSRVESLQKVQRIPWTTCIDARVQMDPESEKHGETIAYAGYLASMLRVGAPVKALLGFPYAAPFLRAVVVNGVRVARDEMTATRNERYLEMELHSGDNLIMIELAGNDHGRGIFMGIDCETDFEWVSPVPERQKPADSPFVSVGPFECFVYIDHQVDDVIMARQRTLSACSGNRKLAEQLDAQGKVIYERFVRAGRCTTAEELAALQEPVRPVPLSLYSKESVMALSMWKKSAERKPAPANLQQAVLAIPEPGIVPLYEDADTEMIIDFGKELTGYLTFEIDAPAGTIIDMYGFEYMKQDWIQHTGYLENTLRYTCREGRQRYTSPVRRGLRYVMVTVRETARPVKLYGVQLWQSHYPAADIGRFHCSDAMLNEIYKISQYTTKLCMEDTFVDCPAYEQAFWVGDSRNEALISYYVLGAEDLVKRCLDLVPGSRSQTPLYADQVPSGWNSVIPNWTFFWAIACHEYYMRTGDLDYARTSWPHVRYTLDHYLQRLDDRGLLYMHAWNFLDWAPIDQPRHGAVAHQNLFLVKTLRCAAELARLAEEPEESRQYAAQAEALAKAINLHLWSEEKKAYLDCIHADGRPSDIFSMQTQVVAYLCDVAEDDRKAQLEAYLLAPPEPFVPIGSPFMSFFYYEALAKLNQVGHMVKDIRKQFGMMIEHGATTCWEMYPRLGRNQEKNLTRSHCHAWSAAPGYFLPAYVLGVRSEEPGWRKVKIEPQPCGLAWAEGAVPLPEEGHLDVSWRLSPEGTIELEVWAPDNVELEIIEPEGYKVKAVIHHNGMGDSR